MDIERIRYFHIFSEIGTISESCKILHISQPALSKALKTLQIEVGQKLLTTEGRNLKLTPAGIEFKRKTTALISQWVNLPNDLKVGDKKKTFKMATFEVFSTYFLSQLAAQLDLNEMELRELGPGQIEEAVLTNVVDFGITYLPIPKQNLEFIEVSKIEMGVFGLTSFKSSNWFDLPFVSPLSPVSGTPSKMMGLDGWPDHQFQRKICYKVTLMESALALCRAGLAVVYLPRFISNLQNQIVQDKFSFQMLDCPIPKLQRKQSVYLVKIKGNEETKEFKKVAKALRGLT